MTADRFARAAESAEELRVWAHGHTAGYELAAEIGRPVLTHTRDQLDAALAEIARRDAEDRADELAWADFIRQGTRGDTRSHLEVLHARAEASGDPDLYADQIARAEANQARVWATPTTTRKAAA